MMNKVTKIALTISSIGTCAVADINYDNPQTIMAELTALAQECARLEPGASQTEIFGIEMIRVGETCAIVNGDELDERVRVFLGKRKLPWAGVGIWVTSPQAVE